MKRSNRSADIYNRNLILFRILDFFPSVYITLISIVESAIIGYLIFKLSDWSKVIHPSSNDVWFESMTACIRIATVAIVIILMWNEYRIGSNVFRWIPNIIDAIIPFLMVFAQILIIEFIGEPHMWLFGMAFFYCIGTWAYLNMYRKSEKMVSYLGKHSNLDRQLESVLTMNKFALNAVRHYRNTNPVYCIFFVVSLLYMAFLLMSQNVVPKLVDLAIHVVAFGMNLASAVLRVITITEGEVFRINEG